MGTTDKADTPVIESYEEKINSLLKTVETDDAGKLVFPEGTSESDMYAVRQTKMARDTRSEYTKVNQQLKVKEAETNKLVDLIGNDVKYDLTPEQAEELDDLKFNDPEAWRQKVNRIEKEYAEKRKLEVKSKLDEVSTSTSLKFQEEQRSKMLNDFRVTNPDLTLTEDVLNYDIPPRITKKLDSGEISYEDYLESVKKYLTKGKKILTADAPNLTNLSSVGGGNTPTGEQLRPKNDIVY